MALQDETFFNAVDDLVPFQTNQGMMNLPTYFHKANQRGQSPLEILYFDESGSATQFNLLCEARGWLVVNANQLFESQFLERYAQIHPHIRLRQLNLKGSDLIFEPLNAEELGNYQRLKLELNQLLPDRPSNVKFVRFKPESIPALIVLSQEAKAQRELELTLQDPASPENVQKLLKDFQASERTLPVTFYVNASNITIQQLAKMPSTEDTQKAWVAIYKNAVMLAQRVLTNKDIEGMFESFNYVINRMISQNNELQELKQLAKKPSTDDTRKAWEVGMMLAQQMLTNKDIEGMFESFNYVIDRMITQTNKVQKLEQRINKLTLEIKDEKGSFEEQTEHIICFFAMPFDPSYELLLKAVRQVLEDKPYGWQVIRADEQQQGKTITANVHSQINCRYLTNYCRNQNIATTIDIQIF